MSLQRAAVGGANTPLKKAAGPSASHSVDTTSPMPLSHSDKSISFFQSASVSVAVSSWS